MAITGRMRTYPSVHSRMLLLAALSASSALACSSTTGEPQDPNAATPAIEGELAAELARHDIHPTSDAREFADTMPADLMAGARWGTVVGPCRAGGYNLSTAAGHPVRLLRYEVDEELRGEPLYVWVVLDADRVACIYRSVRENSEMAPGVFAASGD
jgi:hypothetical protein